MTVKILKSNSEIKIARDQIRRLGASCTTPWVVKKLRHFGLLRGVNVGDYVKSWDVWNTVEFLDQHLNRDARVLDIGAYSSEILCVLHRLGYSGLAGVDLNPAVMLMPHSSAIHYEVADFMETRFGDGSFDVITAISVIEHGFDRQRLLKEISRLLRSGGFFIASIDYWPEGIDTAGLKVFGMDWNIFSSADVQTFIDEARPTGMRPFGEVSLDAAEKTIHWGGKDYTFAWLVLQKSR